MFTLVVNLVQTLHHIYSTFAGMIKRNIKLMWYYYRALWYAFKESCDVVSIDVVLQEMANSIQNQSNKT